MSIHKLELPESQRIGIVSSETSTNQITVDLINAARNRPTNGRMVVIAPEDYIGEREYALGTITNITNRNRYHEDPALRGVIALRGRIGNLTHDADIKTAKIDIQSAFRAENASIRPSGGSMSFAPDTGEGVYLLDNDIVSRLAESVTKDLFYVGDMYRQPGVHLPLSLPDFSSARGAFMCGHFGPSGSGKTYSATYHMASQMRHKNMGLLLVDPQGQFTTNSKIKRELPLDLRALADAQGRDVRQLSVSQEVRLPEEAELLMNMLSSTRFFSGGDMIGATTKAQDVQDLAESWFEGNSGWSEKTPEDLLEELIKHLMNLARSGSIFVSIDLPKNEGADLPITPKPANRLYHNLRSVLHPEEYEDRDGAARKKSMLATLIPILNLFSEHSPDGQRQRMSIHQIAQELCNPDTGSAGKRKPRPLFIVTMADRASSSDAVGQKIAKALGKPKIQGVIFRELLVAIEREARYLYQETTTPANVLVAVDEAARWTSTAARRSGMQELVEEFARLFREIRKYAVGFMLILQEPAALDDSIWKQLSNGFRSFAGGLVGNDLDRVREQVGSSSSMRLYEQLAQPSKDNPVYPFMLCGSISPLSATSNPLFVEMFTSPEQWAEANAEWLPGIFNITDIWQG